MTTTAQKRHELRIRRHRRVRKKVHGTATRPRLAIYRSNKHLTAQVIDDDAGRTVASASTLSAYVPPTAVDEEDRWALDPSAADDKQV